MKTEVLAPGWIANLSILLVIAFFCFLSAGLANAGSYTYTLSGGPSPETPLAVDDDLEVKIPEPEEGREKLNFPENKIKQHEAPISEPEDMEEVLKETYPEKEAARLASAFRNEHQSRR